jgi:hypothetical protein
MQPVTGKGRTPLRGLFAAVAMAVLAAASAASPVPAGSGDVPDPLLAALEKEGWTASESARTFSPDTLYEEIDGEAELYLPYDFRGMTVSILKPEAAAGAGVELRLERYRHGSPKDAFGIWSQYRYPGQELARLGPSEAIVSDASLDFFRGGTFVRLRVASGTMPRATLLALGTRIALALDGPADPPPGIAVLDIPGAISGTFLYQKKAMLGFEPLAPGYEARFDSGGAAGRAIYVEAAGEGETTLRRLSALPGFSGEGEGKWRAALPQGPLFLARAKGGFVGVAGKLTPGQAAPILEALKANAGKIP